MGKALQIELLLSATKRTSVFKPEKPLGFAALRTDHVFLMDYQDGAWKQPRIVPYQSLPFLPGTVAMHYGQSIFEGIRAFKHQDGEIYTFRADRNAARFNNSARLLQMPEIPENIQMEAMLELLNIERLWFPETESSSMYIRPFMWGTQDTLEVIPSSTYTYCIMLAPSGPYYTGGFNKSVQLLITDKFHRAAPGGTGAAKCAGNYSASLRAGQYAKKRGLTQILYLDVTNTNIEECGTMNHFHITKNGEFITPALTDTILDGITVSSVIELCPRLGLTAKRQTIAIDTFLKKVETGEIVEAGALGTAAVVASASAYVREDGSEIKVGDGHIGQHSRHIYELLTGIQTGKVSAPQGWLKRVER